MQKAIKILLCIIAALIVFMGFLLFRSCTKTEPEGAVNPVISASMDASATATPAGVPAGDTPEHSPWADELPMTVGSRGSTVASIQERLRALGFFRYKASGYFVSMTKQAILSFQQKHSLEQDGMIGKQTLQAMYSASVQRASIVPVGVPGKIPSSVRPREYGETTAWSDVNPLIQNGQQFLLIDFSSQIYFNAVRVGGTNHLEFEPADAAQGQKLTSIFGGVTSYEKRACIVQVGDRYFAASFCGMPHGAATVQGNDLGGQFCLYFTGSTAEELPLQDAEHNANIQKACTPAE